MSAAGLPERPTGAELAGAIREAARAAGVSIGVYIRPLTMQGSSWITNLERADQPIRRTVERVAALVGGGTPPPPRTRGPRSRAYQASYAQPALDPVPSQPALDRDPCWRCGTRGDLGCAHRPPAEPYDHFASRRA